MVLLNASICGVSLTFGRVPERVTSRGKLGTHIGTMGVLEVRGHVFVGHQGGENPSASLNYDVCPLQ